MHGQITAMPNHNRNRVERDNNQSKEAGGPFWSKPMRATNKMGELTQSPIGSRCKEESVKIKSDRKISDARWIREAK